MSKILGNHSPSSVVRRGGQNFFLHFVVSQYLSALYIGRNSGPSAIPCFWALHSVSEKITKKWIFRICFQL